MEEEIVQLSHKEFLQTDRDHEKAASVVNLVYVSDQETGISRTKKGKGFSYSLGNKPVKERKVVERIRKLVIPPAWKNVWICCLENGHIQATGLDLRNRKQYRYHGLWNLLRNETKYHRLYEFGKQLPELRSKLEKDLASKELNQEKVLAAVISLMERTYIRIGNAGYEKLYGSYGLTTLKDKHALIKGDHLSFSFKGKKGVYHNISLRNRKLAKIVKECRDIPGKELFQYYDSEGVRKSIDSGMVNSYIKDATGTDFSAKDLRTWAGSVQALEAFQSVGEAITDAERKKNVVAVLDQVSKKLGNTRTVCRKYYVHPRLIQLYEEKGLEKYLKELNKQESGDQENGITSTEKILMNILKAAVH